MKNINEILDNDKATKKDKIDALLRMDADNVCELGTSSTKEEREKTRNKSIEIYKAISEVDEKEGELLLKCVDR